MSSKSRVAALKRRAEAMPRTANGHGEPVPVVSIRGREYTLDELPRSASQLYELTRDYDETNRLLSLKIDWGLRKKGIRPLQSIGDAEYTELVRWYEDHIREYHETARGE